MQAAWRWASVGLASNGSSPSVSPFGVQLKGGNIGAQGERRLDSSNTRRQTRSRPCRKQQQQRWTGLLPLTACLRVL